MAKNIAPTKVTGGGGFGFEDKVAAYFLSYLLSGQPPLDPTLGIISRIDFQTRVDGWFLDDILLTLTLHGQTRHCALSVKSNQQFTKYTAPSEFVSLAWEQFLHEETTRFNKDRDFLGLITAPLSQGVATKLYDLLNKAHSQDPKDLPTHLAKPRDVSKLFASFACPKELAKKHGITEESIGELLRCIEVLEFDFERQSSTRLKEAVRNCRDVLISGSLEEANFLWESLLAIASKYRPNGGYLDLRQLVDQLRSRFRLKDYPSHQADWTRLLNQTRDNLTAIPSKIGNKVFLSRNDELKELETAFNKSKVVVIVGPSGCGKTVIAKSWAEKELVSGKVIWWNARSFDLEDFAAFGSKLSLVYSLGEILSAAPDPYAYVIIDGLDRVFSEVAFQNLSVSIHALRLDIEASPWRVLITCQPEEWDRIQTQLSHANVFPSEWQMIEAKELAADDLNPVWNAFPTLQHLTLQSQLRPLLFKPKILDLLATKLSLGKSVDITKWVGESDFIEWFWNREVLEQPNAASRARFLELLGEKQADNLESETPRTAFSPSDLALFDSLEKDRLCRMHEERLSFYHDLYGDWVRQRVLLGRTQNLQEYLEPRISLPLWHRAVRLYGLHLLERNTDITQWRSALASLGTGENTANLAQDLLLESVIFAANPFPILERLWSDLVANNGLLLRRLLERFLHVATLPNPLILAIAKTLDPDFETEAATMQRIPYWPYWLPMIQFLHRYLADVIEIAPKQVAKVADIWLRHGAENWPLRQEAAELALAKAELILRLKQGDGIRIVEDKVDEITYRATLAGARELPDRVVTFALEASGREKSSAQEEDVPPRWTDGPSRRVDSAFQEICLETDALHPLIVSNPGIAHEVLLALLIEEPKIRHPLEYRIDDDLGIGNTHRWFPPFYTRGPFLFFLKNQPMEGVEAILRLVNFASKRWADSSRKKDKVPAEVVIMLPDGERKWIGNYRVYYWYRDLGPCPHPVVVALMALEKWLYDEIDEKRPIDTIVESILQQSNSVAFAGLLSVVGCKDPSLFQGSLQPLLAVPEFHHWELKYSLQSDNYLMISWLNQGEQLTKLAREWYTLPHRRHGLYEWAQTLFLNDPQIRLFLEQVRSNWSRRLEILEEGDELKDYLEQLVAQYNIKNYKVQKHPEHGDIWVFEPPEKLRVENEKILKNISERQLLLTFPLNCRQILDAGQPLLPENLEQFWNILQRVSGLTPPADIEPGVINVEAAICGGVAVLLHFHRDWLEQYPEREEWCMNQLLKTIHNPPKAGKFDVEENASDYHWDSFCAQVLPLLWAEDPDLPILRECVASLATSYHYKTVAILINSAAKHRSRLGESFKQLQHFLLRWAATRWKWKRTRHEKRPFDVEAWLQREVKAFVKGSISPQIPPLEELAVEEHLRKYSRSGYYKRRPRQSPGLDLELIQAAYAWLPSLDQAASETERAEWIAFWKEALGCTLRMLGEETGDDEEIDGTPYDWDRWVFDHIAPLIMELRPTEHPKDFWKPILTLGPPGHYWIKDFLREWFLNGLRSERDRDVFVLEWRAMAEFAFFSPKWDFDLISHRFHLEEMWCHMMGFDWIVSDMWSAAQKPIVRQMHDIYERWGRAHLKRARCAVPFIAFLKQPAAEEILLDGIIWLEKAASQADDQFWSERNIQESLASLLDVCWRSHQSRLRQHQTSFGAFMNLLKSLADHQNTLAMELQDRMSM